MTSNTSNSVQKTVSTPPKWGSFLAVFGVCFLLCLPFLKSSEQRAHEALIASAQSVAYQAWELEQRRKAVSNQDSSRAPSSVEDSTLGSVEGSLGLDPQGRPFHYKIRVEGESRIVDVWTEGPQSVKTQVFIPNPDSAKDSVTR